MPSFQERIHMIVPDQDARHVEGFMRDAKNGNLDQLTGEEFYELCLVCSEKAKADPRKGHYLADVARLRHEEV